MNYAIKGYIMSESFNVTELHIYILNPASNF